MARDITVSSAQLDHIISDTVRELASKLGVGINQSTIDAFLERDQAHEGQSIFVIDTDLVASTIDGLLRTASTVSSSGFVDGSAIEIARATYECHYLWWC